MPRASKIFPPALALAVIASCLVWRPCPAAVYTWKDERGVVHMTDHLPPGSDTSVQVMGDTSGPLAPGPGDRRRKIEDMIAKAKAEPGYKELQSIAADYQRSHTFSATDYFVCVDMALEMANILKTKGFFPKVTAGSIKVDLAGLDKKKLGPALSHAWVMVELKPGIYAPVETTAGYVVDAKVQNFEFYYQGLVFENPRQAKETDALIRNAVEQCQNAQDLIEDWNANYSGRQTSPQVREARGRLDAKVSECQDYNTKYQILIDKQYRTFY